MSAAIADKSCAWVRRAVGSDLWAGSKNLGRRNLAERLVADVNLRHRQERPIKAIGRWPLAEEPARSLLTAAMEGRTHPTRKAAAQQLAKLWPPATEFEIEATAQRRATRRWSNCGRSGRDEFSSIGRRGGLLANAPGSADWSRRHDVVAIESRLAEVEKKIVGHNESANDRTGSPGRVSFAR